MSGRQFNQQEDSFDQIAGDGVLDNKVESKARNKLETNRTALSLIYVRLNLWLSFYQISKASNIFIPFIELIDFLK